MSKIIYNLKTIVLFCLLLQVMNLSAQVKLPADLVAKMNKYHVRFERIILSQKTDTLLAGYSPFTSSKKGVMSKLVMFKNKAEKINLAYYVDTCFNHYNLESELRNDMAGLFELKDERKYSIVSQNEWSVLLNADDVQMAVLKDQPGFLKPFADYRYTVIVGYYNNVTKGKIYLVINFENEINDLLNAFVELLMDFSFTPHQPVAKMEPELIIQSGSNDEINSIAISKTGELMAYGGLEGRIKIALGDGSKELRTIKAHNKQILNIKFSDNERLLISCSLDSTIKVWEVQTGKLVGVLAGHKDRVNDVAFFDHDRKIISSSSDSTLKFWDVAKLTCYKTKSGFKNKISQIELGVKGNKAIINLLKGNIMLLDLENFHDTILKSGFERITDFAFPYSNAIALTNGKSVKFIYTDSDKERIVSDESDSAYSRMVPIFMNDSANNVRLILLTNNGYCRVYDYVDHAYRNQIINQDYSSQKYFSLAYNPYNNIVFYGGVTYIQSYNLSTTELVYIQGTGTIPLNTQIDKNNEFLVINYSKCASLLSLKTGRIVWNSITANSGVNDVCKINKTTGNLFFANQDSMFCSFNHKNNKIIYQAKPISYPIHYMPLASDSCFLYLTQNKDVYLHKSGKNIQLQKEYNLKGLNLIRDTFLVFEENEIACLKNIYTEKVIELGKFKLYNWIDLANENSTSFTLRTLDTCLFVFDKWTFKKTNEITDKQLVNSILYYTLHPTDNQLLITSRTYEVNVIDLGTKKQIASWKPHIGYLWKTYYTGDGKRIISSGTDAFVRVWDAKTFSHITSTYSSPYGGYITTTPSNYYVASASFASAYSRSMAYFSYGNTTFDLADLDLEYNRPDIISAALGYESPEMIDAYKKLHDKRLKRLNVTSSASIKNDNRPVLRSIYTYPAEVSKSNLRLFFVLHDDYKKLKSIKITINDVPVHGVEGTHIIDGYDLSTTNSIPIAYTIMLNKGYNKVSVKVTNEDNVESYPYTFTTWYSNSENVTKPKLHIIGIGVSKFKNENYNLKYPAKDVRDIIKLFQNQKNQYSQIIVDTLLNDSATLDNILKLKDKIQRDHNTDSVGVNDKIVLFAATHGMLDKNLDYYLATYDVNFDNPSEKGLLYSEIEGLLDGISPRNKVVLIDACHSGEIDKDEIVQTKTKAVEESGAVAFRSASSTKISASEGKLNNSINLMKEMFIDLRKTSGATVISSAGGTEYAMEGEEWNNGVFSYSLINALRKHKADKNNDNKVYLSELQKYIEDDVPAITNGKQQPTSRSENILNDVLIWRNDFNEELASAIKTDDKELVDKLLKDGADIGSIDTNGATTLMWAVMFSDLTMVKKLVAAKADITSKGIIYPNPTNKESYYGNLTGIAAATNKLDILKYLIEVKKIDVNDREYNPTSKKQDGWNALTYAVSSENSEIINYLISKGADVNRLVDSTLNHGLEQMVFSKGNKQIIELLIAKGLNYKRINKNGYNIITQAATSINPEVLKLALKLNKKLVNEITTDSLSALMLASFYGKAENVKLLVSNGANIKSLTTGGQTIVHLAARSKNVETLKQTIIAYPEALNKQDKNGLPPLLSAAIVQHIETISYLLENGADMNLKDINGENFEDYAKYYKNEEMLNLLKKYKK